MRTEPCNAAGQRSNSPKPQKLGLGETETSKAGLLAADERALCVAIRPASGCRCCGRRVEPPRRGTALRSRMATRTLHARLCFSIPGFGRAAESAAAADRPATVRLSIFETYDDAAKAERRTIKIRLRHGLHGASRTSNLTVARLEYCRRDDRDLAKGIEGQQIGV